MDQPTPALQTAAAQPGAPLGFAEFVALIAAMMALTALGIDSLLPALPAIRGSLGVDEANHRQFVITAFLLGFAFVPCGPVRDSRCFSAGFRLSQLRTAADRGAGDGNRREQPE